MSEDEAQQLIQKLLLQALSRRLPQSKWLSLLHQLVRRIEAAQNSTSSIDTVEPLAASYVAGCLVQYILSQSSLDPLLIEYLQALIYGSANRTGLEPDQGPVTDVITATLHLLAANVNSTTAFNVPAIETISSVIGQGLLMTFQAPIPFHVSNPSFLHLLQHLFAQSATEREVSSSSTSANGADSTSNDGSIAQSALAFIVSNLRLLSLAADRDITSPQNLLAPRVAITVLINVGQNLLAHVIQRLSAAQASKDAKAKPQIAVLQQTRSKSKTSINDIEAVLQSMNPAWKDEIALLRSLTSQIGVIDQLSEALSEASSSSTASSLNARRKKAETLQDAQSRATWDHFLDVSSASSSSKPAVEPETALLMHLLIDHHVSWNTKLDAVKTLFLARRNAAAPSLALEKSLAAFYFELLLAAIDACASVVEMPPAFKGAEVYAAIWRNALCGMIPEIVLQLEQWLDVHQDLPLRGQRLEAPHVRFESALRASLLVMSERLNVCETAGGQLSAGAGDGADAGAAGPEMSNVVGLDTPPSQPIKAWLLRACIEHSLARPEAIADEFPDGHKLASEVQSLSQSLRMDAQLEGMALNTLFETRISTDDPLELLQRVASDPGTHFIFARQLVLQVQGWLEQHDLESVARWCKALSQDACDEAGGAMLDTIMLYLDPAEVVEPLASILDHQDVGQTSDEPSTLSDVLLFVQLVCYRFDVAPSRIKRYSVNQEDDMQLDGSSTQQDSANTSSSSPPFLATYIATSPASYPLPSLTGENRLLVSRWIQALFGNEGISDDLISASSPPTLLRLSPLLFSQSISACLYGIIDLETLRGGLSYFLQDLLSFTLPGALNWLLAEIPRVPSQPILDVLNEAGLQAAVVDVVSSDGMLANGLRRNATSRTVHLEVLALLLDTDACVGVVRELVGKSFDGFVRWVQGRGGALEEGCETFNLASLKGRMESAGVTARLLSGTGSWLRTLANSALHQPQQQQLQLQVPRGQTQPQPQIQVQGDSKLISLLCSGKHASSQHIERLLSTLTSSQSLQMGSGKGNTDQKALAAWLCLIAPSLDTSSTTKPPVLSFIAKHDFASIEESAIESVIRTVRLVSGLIRASEAIRAPSANGEGDAAAQIHAFARSSAGVTGASANKTTEAAEGGLFDEDEPSTPPLPSTTTGAAENRKNAAGASVATLLTSSTFRVTSQQILDLLALKLVRFREAVDRRGGARVQAAKWSAVEGALIYNAELFNNAAEGAKSGEATATSAEPENALLGWLNALQS
ncbi:probable Mediator of RNA polymerase II transcription subunit 5 [Ustilago sp. UG-2017b]|nr:probable Mediator of RNA polymerase II transcription subunit 5 [Ustilago sp. UG-2017b]